MQRKSCLLMKVTHNEYLLTVVPARLDCLPVLVGVTHKVGVGTRPPLHSPGVQAHSSLLIKLLKVLCVQGVLDSGLMWGLSAVQVVPVNPVEEGVVLRDQSLTSAALQTNKPAAIDMLYEYLVHTGLSRSMLVCKSNIICVAIGWITPMIKAATLAVQHQQPMPYLFPHRQTPQTNMPMPNAILT